MYIIKDGALQGNCQLTPTSYIPRYKTSGGRNYSCTIVQNSEFIRFSRTANGSYENDRIYYYITKQGWESLGWSLQVGDIIHYELKFTPYPEAQYSSQSFRFGLWNGSTSSDLSPVTTVVKNTAKTDHQLVVTSGTQGGHFWLIDFDSAGPSGTTSYLDIYNIWVERN